MDDKQTLDIEHIQLDDNCYTPPISPKDNKRKKKKKRNKANLVNLHEADEDKNSKQFQKSSTFPISASRPIPVRKSLEYEDVHNSVESSPTSPLSSSCPALFSLRSALRGGHEGLGLGPRPKLHVKWAVDVHDTPPSTVSHTLNRNISPKKKKNSKSNKLKTKPTKKQQAQTEGKDNGFTPEANEHVSMQSQANADEANLLEYIVKTGVNGKYITVTQNNLSSSMDVAMQHMQLASNFIEKENVAGALIEYKAAAEVFRLAKEDAQTETEQEFNSLARQALRGQVLAWIAMATLYSVSGQLQKGQKCHNLALQACQDSGLSFPDSVELQSSFPRQFKSNLCSLEDSKSGNDCGSSRREVI